MERPRQHRFAALVLVLSCFCFFFCVCNAHNVTRVLAGHPSFSLFNEYLTKTKIADDINSRSVITILAVENASVSAFLDQGYGIETLKHILSLHVLLDYMDAAKLHNIRHGSMLSTTLYQTSGAAKGMDGFMRITDLNKGAVGFRSNAQRQGSKAQAYFTKTIVEEPYNLSVVQLSNLIVPSRIAEAPTVEPEAVNLTAVLVRTGHSIFARLLNQTGVMKTYEKAIAAGGLTVFAPNDGAFRKVMKKIKALSPDAQVKLLEFHALPVYGPLGTLRSSNAGINTLATGGRLRYSLTVRRNGESSATLHTGLNSAIIDGTLLDSQPLVLFYIDKVMLPPEIFTPVPLPAPSISPLSPPEPPSTDVTPSEAPDPGHSKEAVTDNSSTAVSAGMSPSGIGVTVLLLLLALDFGHM